jgi:ABC-type sugar transport system ATPase subunit
MLQATHLHLQAGAFRVEDVSLSVAEGECLVLMGATGSGKSLLAKALCGLRRIESGAVSIDGREVTRLEPRRRHIGYLPQSCALFPHQDVAHNVTFASRVRGLSHRKALAAAQPVTDLLGIGGLLSRRTDTLSGGERQKVALARALTAQPKVLILDEPLSALDEPTRREIAVELRDVQQALRVATLHICHNTEEAETLADRVGVMHAGRLLQVGLLDELRRAPTDAAVTRLLENGPPAR